MSDHIDRKRSAEAKAQTLLRRARRARKYAVRIELDDDRLVLVVTR